MQVRVDIPSPPNAAAEATHTIQVRLRFAQQLLNATLPRLARQRFGHKASSRASIASAAAAARELLLVRGPLFRDTILSDGDLSISAKARSDRSRDGARDRPRCCGR